MESQFFKPTEKERRIIMVAHDKIIKNMQGFLEYKQAQRSKRKLGLAL
jgi:hypothetical protein